MPIQPHFALDIISTIAQAPEKSSGSHASLMDFLFKEFIYQEHTPQSPAPSQAARSQETKVDPDNKKEEGSSEEEEVTLPGFWAMTSEPAPKEHLSLEKIESSLEQAFTMIQLDQMLEASLQSKDLKTEITGIPLPSSAIESDSHFFQEVTRDASPPIQPLSHENKGKIKENPSLPPQEGQDFSSSFEIKEVSLLEESSLFHDQVSQENFSQEITPFLSGEADANTAPAPSSFETSLTTHTTSLSTPLSVANEEPSPSVTTPSAAAITPQILEQLPQSLFSVQGNHHIQIQLYPEELGEVTINLKIGDKKNIQAIFSAASSGTLDLLRQEAPQLLQALKKEGFDVASENFQFNAQQDSPQERPSQPAFSSPNRLIQEESPGSPNDAFERRAFSSKRLENNLVDIRVY